jgi:predicted permease
MNGFFGLLLEILSITGPIFIIIALGYFIRLKGILKEDSVIVLNRLAYNVGMPAIIFLSITRYKFSDIFSFDIIKIIYTTYIIVILLIFLSTYLFKTDNKTKGAIIVSTFRCNMTFMGFPIVLAAFGSLAIAKASIVIAFLIPVNIALTIIIFMMHDRNEEKVRLKKIILSLVLDPIMIAVALGIVVSYFNFILPAPMFNVLDIKLLSYISFAKLILLPLVALLLCIFIFRVDGFDRNVIVILFSMPLAVMTFVMGKEYNSNSKLISSALILTTILSALTISVWLLVLRLI